MTTSILLTGSAGFIGSHLAEALLSRGDEVFGVDNFNEAYDPARKRRNVEEIQRAWPRFQMEAGDIRDAAFLDRLCEGRRFDAIIHLAAMAGVRVSVDQPQPYVEVNVGGLLNVLELARRHRIPRVVFASSSSVYGHQARVPFREEAPVGWPLSPYAATKQMGETLCSTWHYLHGLQISALRFFTVYGPRQRPDMAIHRFARQIINGEPLIIYGNHSGLRDYTFVTDIVRGVIAALDRCRGFEIYNLASGQGVPLREMISLLARELGVEPQLHIQPAVPGDMPETGADLSKARDRLGYAPSVQIQEGLQRFVAWFNQEHRR